MKLEDILARFPEEIRLERPCNDIEVSGISLDSRRVNQGDIFVALEGTTRSGLDFVQDAIKRGAGAIMVSSDIPEDLADVVPSFVPVIPVVDPRGLTGRIASFIYGNDGSPLTIAGITGTNGKTTVTYLLEGIFQEEGLNPGVIGTINQRQGGYFQPSKLTTPDPVSLQECLARMRENGAKAVAMEISSHAILQKRISGCRFKAATFTNLSRDHLDYHRNMESYFQAKARLFTEFPCETAVLNMDDPYGARLWHMVRGKRLSFGLDKGAIVRPTWYRLDTDGISCTISLHGERIGISSRLMGLHNLYNILAASCTALAMGCTSASIKKGIERVEVIPGRLQRIARIRDALVLVDYAHTPDALEKVLGSLRRLTKKRLVCLVGCGGDRDKGKRPLMARVAAVLCDLAIFTSDNPRSEDPESIINDMLDGIRGGTGSLLEKTRAITDRREAIRWAIEQLAPGDCLLVAGKGHEKYQVIGTRKVPFDDVAVIREEIGGLSRLSDVAGAIGAHLPVRFRDVRFKAVSTDSRAVREGELFWALTGDNFDGNRFVESALQKGAVAAVAGPDLEDAVTREDRPVLTVQDTLKALGDYAGWYRATLSIKVVGITGSCGKTSTKDLVASILQAGFPVGKTPGNFNNLVGLPLSILALRPGQEFAVLEMGTNHPGEIARLCEIAAPDIGLITCIRPAHLEGLGTLREIAREKWCLWRSLSPKGIAVVNLDDILVFEGLRYTSATCIIGYTMKGRTEWRKRLVMPRAGMEVRNILHCPSWSPGPTGTRMIIEADNGRSVDIMLPLIGEANVQNALAAASVGIAAGLPLPLIKAGLEKACAPPGRLVARRIGKAVTIIEDHYNANPGSMEAALKVLGGFGNGCRRVAILGDMLELGSMAPSFHENLGRQASETGLDTLITVGNMGNEIARGARRSGFPNERIHTFTDTDELLEWLGTRDGLDTFRPSSVILVKGSRAVGLERASEALCGSLGACAFPAKNRVGG